MQVGDSITFQVTGDFPIKGVVRSLTFDVTLNIVSETELRGLATTVAADVAPSPVREGEPVQLALPRDALDEPWHLVVSDAPVRVCGAA